MQLLLKYAIIDIIKINFAEIMSEHNFDKITQHQTSKTSNVNLLTKSDIYKFVNKNKENEYQEEQEIWSNCLFDIMQYKKTGNDEYLESAINNFKILNYYLREITEKNMEDAKKLSRIYHATK